MTLPTITQAEWLEELNSLGAFEADEGYTAKELSQQWGRSTKWVLARLAQAREAGLLVCGYRPGEALDGRRTRVPVYQLLKKQGDDQ